MDYFKVSGSWKEVATPFIKVAGQWKASLTEYVKVNGVWVASDKITIPKLLEMIVVSPDEPKWKQTGTGVSTIMYNEVSTGNWKVTLYGDKKQSFIPVLNNATDIHSIVTASGDFSMHDLFRGLSKLTTIDLSGLDVTKTVSTSFMLNGSSSLTNITGMTGWQLNECATTMGMFAGCNVSSIDVSGWNIPKCTDVSHMFRMANNTNIDLSTWTNTDIVVNYSNMFKDSAKLTKINLDGLSFKHKPTHLNSMFSNLATLTCISKIDTTSLTGSNAEIIGIVVDMFKDTPKLVHPTDAEQTLIKAGGYKYEKGSPCT